MVQAGRAGYGASWLVRFTVVVVRLACMGGLLLAALGTVPVRAVGSATPTAGDETHAGVATAYGKLPLAFEANAGQADAGVRFVAHGSGFALALAPDAFTLALRSGTSAGTGSAVRFAFAGANPAPTLGAEQPLPGVANYFIGNDPAQWHTNVPTSAQVRYTGLYPGIDLTVYGTEGGGVEYDALVAPGADPAAFALAISGAEAVAVDADTGDLVLTTPAGEVRQHAPVAYQEVNGARVPVAARYDMRVDGSVGFVVGEYDATLPLVIDPAVVLVYSTYLGGTGDEGGNGIAVDASGNAYVTGYTRSPDFPVTPGAFQATFSTSGDAFVTKLNATGTALVYSTYLGGTGNDDGRGIAVDSSGNAYVTGHTNSTDFPVTPGAFQSALSGTNTDAFVTKVNTTGTALVYSTYLGGTGSEQGYGIAVDASGNAYVTGRTYSTNFPVTPGAFQPTFSASGDAFVTKLNTTGTALVYSTYLGGTGSEYGNGIAVDANGNAYVTGYTRSPDFPVTPGAFQATNGGGSGDAFVTKLNATGTALVYSTYLGGTGSDASDGIAVDASGNAYVTGYTNSPNFPVTPGAFQATNGGGSGDAFVAKVNATGTALVYSTYLGGTGDDYGYGIAVDSSGNAYVTGQTSGTDFPVTTGAFQATNGGLPGSYDAFVTKVNTTGTALVYSTYLGGTGYEEGDGIAVDANGNAYVSGYTESTNFPLPPAPLQATNGGGSGDAFVAKVSPPPAVTFTVTGFPSPVPSGTAATVTVTARDANNNVVTDYSGTVAITSSDLRATLPANATLTNGVGTFTVTLRTPGIQSITATDTVKSTLTGTQSGIIVTGTAPTAVNDSYSVTTGTTLTVPAASGCAGERHEGHPRRHDHGEYTAHARDAHPE